MAPLFAKSSPSPPDLEARHPAEETAKVERCGASNSGSASDRGGWRRGARCGFEGIFNLYFLFHVSICN
ncbi:hypothetical protein NL676_039427 [Syzygium grande]|nr:hypothetical protein NL676_039427 [Syzygium grande]